MPLTLQIQNVKIKLINKTLMENTEGVQSTQTATTSPFGQDQSTVPVPTKPVIQTIRPGDTTPDTTGDGTSVSVKPDRFNDQKEMPPPEEETPSRFNITIPRQDLALYAFVFIFSTALGFGLGLVLSSL